MQKASIRDLRIRTSELVKAASEGEIIVIQRRGEAVAELRPLTRRKTKPKIPDMSRFWKRYPRVPGDSGRFLEEDR
ncbi:MAG TPA: type II toxin-antitoxin system prevent-host-death family antitoxin [Bryobacteraceae bacterium]|nr:type II toxin-antitoxin system prevent-host-death family antitoxin [Bryobacteraceae bacterium]